MSLQLGEEDIKAEGEKTGGEDSCRGKNGQRGEIEECSPDKRWLARRHID